MKQHQHDRTNFSTQEHELILYSQKDDIFIISMGCRENSDKEDFFYLLMEIVGNCYIYWLQNIAFMDFIRFSPFQFVTNRMK